MPFVALMFLVYPARADWFFVNEPALDVADYIATHMIRGYLDHSFLLTSTIQDCGRADIVRPDALIDSLRFTEFRHGTFNMTVKELDSPSAQVNFIEEMLSDLISLRPDFRDDHVQQYQTWPRFSNSFFEFSWIRDPE